MAEVDGKVAVITGAGSGLGKAAAGLFAVRGAKLVLADITGAEEDVAASAGGEAIAVRCDVRDEAQVEAMLRAAVDRFGRVDAVLNVAGVSSFARIGDLEMSEYDRILDIDLRGVVHGVKHAVRVMKAAGGGVILNFASVAAFGAKPELGIYSAAKAGILAVTRAAAVEYAKWGVRTNAIAPGLFMTEAAAALPPDMVDQVTANIPMNRGGDPSECAELAAFLVSDRARFINGAVIVIDGGQTAQLP